MSLQQGGTDSATTAPTSMSGGETKEKIEPAPPTHGIPGQDLVEEQPVRNPITESSTVLVVGGNRGIGLEFVQQCAQNKCARVIATYRPLSTDKQNIIPESLQTLTQKYDNIETLALDVTDERSIASAFQGLQTRDSCKPLTHVIHCAGAYPKGMSLDGTSRGGRPPQPIVTKEDMMQSYLVNAVGPLLVAQAVMPLLQQRKGPASSGRATSNMLPVYAILSSKVGSVYDNTSGGTYAYRSSKAAVNNIAKSLSVDLAGEASVVCLHPGYVRTDMTGGKGLIDTKESVEGMLRAIEATDDTVGFRFVDYKACIIPW